MKLLEGNSSTSPVLWHFTGGPKWDETTGVLGESIKPENEAYDLLINILLESNLRLSTYREEVSYIVATPSPGIGGVTDTIKLNPVCCLAEIPVHNLKGHSDRYGKFALGFNRSEAMDFGFRPVIYALDDDWVLKEIRKEWYEIMSNRPAISKYGTGDVMDWPEDTPQEKADKEALIKHFKRNRLNGDVLNSFLRCVGHGQIRP